MTPELRASLREACGRILPLSPLYAEGPVEAAFDWSPLERVPFGRLYLVVFRSVRRADADVELLRRRDDRAYRSARRSGGLLLYFKGDLDERRRCLSFCLWETREQAVRAAASAPHARAAEISERTYESYDLERYDLLRDDGRLHFRLASPLPAAV